MNAEQLTAIYCCSYSVASNFAYSYNIIVEVNLNDY